MRRSLAIAMLTASGCVPALRPVPVNAPGVPADRTVEAVRELARRIERETDAPSRERLAVAAVETARSCGPEPACDYWLAVALGLQARERPSTASDGVARMLELLASAEASDPALEHGGPARVTALVLVRAPGWPLGPGDADAGLAAARRAVGVDPDYPPNRLALAEALLKHGERDAAAEQARAADDVARRSSDPDAADWSREAELLLNRR